MIREADELAMRFGRRWAPALLGLLLAVALAGCGEEEEVAEPREAVPNVTPTALAALPEGVEEATLEIRDAAFGVDEVILQEAEPTVLHVVNYDDRTYLLRIVEDLVTATPIPAATTTNVAFTTPKAAEYEGQLLDAESEDVLDTVDVVVQAPGGV